MPRSPHLLTAQNWKNLQDKLLAGTLDIKNPLVPQAIRAYYETRLLEFGRNVLREHVLDEDKKTILPFCPMHTDIEDLVLNTDNKRIAIAAPRGHSKSTTISFFYVLHQALFQKNNNIVIVSSSEAIAVSFLRRIKEELEYNPRLIQLFGNLRSDKWSETEIILTNHVSIHAKGRGAQLRGLISGANRPDLIILDDLEDEELVRSEIRRSDLESWFNGTVLPTLAPKLGQVILVGTILHQDSLLNNVLTKYKEFITKKYAALKEDDTPLWPERFTVDSLHKIRDAFISRGQLPQFYMEYMNDPTPEGAAVFHFEDFQFYDPDKLPPRSSLTVEVAVDLGGGSTRKSADDTAIVVTATDLNNKVYVLEVIAEQMAADSDMLIDHLFRVNETYSPSTILIEKTMATNFLNASLEHAQLARNRFLPITLVAPPKGAGARQGMSDAKFQRISALVPNIKAGNILFLPNQHKLFKQSLDFPRAKHDDILDALAYAWMFGHRAVRQEEQDSEEEEPTYMHAYSELYN